MRLQLRDQISKPVDGEVAVHPYGVCRICKSLQILTANAHAVLFLNPVQCKLGLYSPQQRLMIFAGREHVWPEAGLVAEDDAVLRILLQQAKNLP